MTHDDIPPNRRKARVAILISGRGSNMAALIEAAKNPAYPAEIACVISNVPNAGGLAVAAAEGIPTITVDHRAFAGNREAFEQAVQAHLLAAAIDIVALAGFMRVLTPWLVSRWQNRMVNIHPSLLPAFRGLDTHRRALEAGVTEHGATVHFVTTGLDEGPSIAQARVPVLPDDTPGTLAERVLAVEHALYIDALKEVACAILASPPPSDMSIRPGV